MNARLLALALLLTGCRTVETRPVASSPPPVLRVGARARVWEVRHGAERLGQVVLFQERGLARDCVYVVRNAWNQDLGLIDGLGRAYRYVPHLDEPTWLGSGTIALGAERILGASDCTLVELGAAPEGGSEPAALAAGQAPLEEPLAPVARPSNAPAVDGGLPQSR
ncbi:MAG TPA: hypothetical protein VF530_14320 [Planctomycetota bacterium]